MTKISIVIISFNAARTIENVLRSALQLSNDVVVLDSKSSDQTKEICLKYSVNFQEQDWLGYGKQKNIANAFAKHDWILSLDADEVLSETLMQELRVQELENGKAYQIRFQNIYCGKQIHFGRWKNEKHVRLFHKKEVSWNENAVHERLKLEKVVIHSLTGFIQHYSMNSKAEHYAKAKKYALMGAEKLKKQGKKATFVKQYINPIFRFVKDYFFSLGFLDGKLGFQIAFIIAKETYWKYQNLKKLE